MIYGKFYRNSKRELRTCNFYQEIITYFRILWKCCTHTAMARSDFYLANIFMSY